MVFRPLRRPAIYRGFFLVRARNRTLTPAAAALAERVLSEVNGLGSLGEGAVIKVQAGLSIADLVGPAFTH
jgi:hypothetical protein